jgi:hypothetical protein
VFRLSARISEVFRVAAKQAVMSLAMSLGGIVGCAQLPTKTSDYVLCCMVVRVCTFSGWLYLDGSDAG